MNCLGRAAQCHAHMCTGYKCIGYKLTGSVGTYTHTRRGGSGKGGETPRTMARDEKHSNARHPCICMVLWRSNSACVDGVHAPAKPACGRHVGRRLAPSHLTHTWLHTHTRKGGEEEEGRGNASSHRCDTAVQLIDLHTSLHAHTRKGGEEEEGRGDASRHRCDTAV